MNWDDTSISKNSYYHMLSMLVIKNDCETLKALVPIVSQPIIGLIFLPYYAHFCSAINEYLTSKGFIGNLTNNSPFEISDVRNKLKMFDDTYGKIHKQVLTVDDIQDREFKSKLRLSSIENQNIHYNLGIFVNENRHIIGNTQYLYYMFQDKRFLNKDLKGDNVKEFGYLLGSVINSVCQGLKDFEPNYQVDLHQVRYQVLYKDFNTNKSFNFLPYFENGKELSLLLLHILCSLNFARYILDDFVPESNTWSLRVKYIIMYYAYRSIERIIEYLPSNTINLTATEYKKLQDSEFRSCMMHYDFINKGNFIILDNHLDYRLPFFGLIESRFIGMSYNSLYTAITRNIVTLSDEIANIIKPSLSNCKHL